MTSHRPGLTRTVGRGLLAGAVGTALLDAASWLDVALTGRAGSDAPGETALRVARRAGLHPPDDAQRRAAYGALGGLGAGLGVGVLASGARRVGVRLPAPLGVAVTGAAAMAATDLPMTLTGVSDPRRWSRVDWTRDVLPHLAFGLGVRWTLDRTEPRPPVVGSGDGRPPVTGGLLARSFTLGLAAGCRSSIGLAAPALAAGGPARTLLATGLVAGELTADKLPAAPSRTEPAPAGFRGLSGAAGGWFLARRRGARPLAPALAGATGAAAGTFAGAVWREVAQRRGLTWQAAVAEDAVALGLATLAVRGSSTRA